MTCLVHIYFMGLLINAFPAYSNHDDYDTNRGARSEGRKSGSGGTPWWFGGHSNHGNRESKDGLDTSAHIEYGDSGNKYSVLKSKYRDRNLSNDGRHRETFADRGETNVPYGKQKSRVKNSGVYERDRSSNGDRDEINDGFGKKGANDGYKGNENHGENRESGYARDEHNGNNGESQDRYREHSGAYKGDRNSNGHRHEVNGDYGKKGASDGYRENDNRGGNRESGYGRVKHNDNEGESQDRHIEHFSANKGDRYSNSDRDEITKHIIKKGASHGYKDNDNRGRNRQSGYERDEHKGNKGESQERYRDNHRGYRGYSGKGGSHERREDSNSGRGKNVDDHGGRDYSDNDRAENSKNSAVDSTGHGGSRGHKGNGNGRDRIRGPWWFDVRDSSKDKDDPNRGYKDSDRDAKDDDSGNNNLVKYKMTTTRYESHETFTQNKNDKHKTRNKDNKRDGLMSIKQNTKSTTRNSPGPISYMSGDEQGNARLDGSEEHGGIPDGGTIDYKDNKRDNSVLIQQNTVTRTSLGPVYNIDSDEQGNVHFDGSEERSGIPGLHDKFDDVNDDSGRNDARDNVNDMGRQTITGENTRYYINSNERASTKSEILFEYDEAANMFHENNDEPKSSAEEGESIKNDRGWTNNNSHGRESNDDADIVDNGQKKYINPTDSDDSRKASDKNGDSRQFRDDYANGPGDKSIITYDSRIKGGKQNNGYDVRDENSNNNMHRDIDAGSISSGVSVGLADSQRGSGEFAGNRSIQEQKSSLGDNAESFGKYKGRYKPSRSGERFSDDNHSRMNKQFDDRGEPVSNTEEHRMLVNVPGVERYNRSDELGGSVDDQKGRGDSLEKSKSFGYSKQPNDKKGQDEPHHNTDDSSGHEKEGKDVDDGKQSISSDDVESTEEKVGTIGYIWDSNYDAFEESSTRDGPIAVEEGNVDGPKHRSIPNSVVGRRDQQTSSNFTIGEMFLKILKKFL